MAEEFDHRSERREYGARPLLRSELPLSPLQLFAGWLQAAVANGLKDATAMALATASTAAAPSVRMVLLKHYDAEGFCWYTDYRSRKGLDLAQNPVAAALFYWPEWDRQARITGPVERLSEQESEAYFQSRPAASRFAAAASVQSAEIADRAVLERAVASLRQKHLGEGALRPRQWGGYRLKPVEYEFWQGRKNRLHDRFIYRKGSNGRWSAMRLQP